MEINRIYNENCLATMKRMPDNFVDLTVTSPPYDDLREYHGCEWNLEIFQQVAQELYRVTKPGGVVVWVVNDKTENGSETLTTSKQKIFFREDCGFNIHDTMIWEKPGPSNPATNRYHQIFEYMIILAKGKPKTFNGLKDRKNLWIKRFGKGSVRQKNGEMSHHKADKYQYDKFGLRFNIWYIKNVAQENICQPNEHPAPFPEKLTADHIYSWSNEGDLIYDPFGGSGTTVKMAHLMKRNWIMSEISEEYCAIAEKRLKPYLQQMSLF